MSIAQPTREIPWADTAANGHVVEPENAVKGEGWTGTTRPPFQWFNWILRQAARWIQYLRARGIPDYDAGETYSPGDRVQFSDAGPPYLTFVCIQANSPAAPKSPYDHAYWEMWGHTQSDLKAVLARGIPDYDAAESYGVGDRVQYTDGLTYVCTFDNIGTVPTNHNCWQRWGYSTSDLNGYLGAKTLRPIGDVAVSVGEIAGSFMLRIAGSGSGGSGFKVVALNLVDTNNPAGYFDLTLTNIAAFTTAVVQVTPTGDIDGRKGSVVVDRLNANTWRISWPLGYVSGPHPGYSVTFTGFSSSD